MSAQRSLLMLVVLALIVLRPGAVAAAPALDLTGGADVSGGSDATFGWRFTVTSPLTIGGLGIFDVGANGLGESHEVGLWASDGSLLASTTITTANSTPVASTSTAGNWRATAITPLTLTNGDYVVGAFYPGQSADLMWGDIFTHVFGLGVSTVPGVTWDIARFILDSSFQFPSGEDQFSIGFFGPNVFTAEATAAEPLSLVLVGSGLVGLVGRAAWKGTRRHQTGGVSCES